MNNKDVTEFVIDCLTDAGNRDKQAALHQWLQKSEDNQALYATLKQLWETTAVMPPLVFDKEEGWKELSQVIAAAPAGRFDDN
jgi:transmembrane sensor